MNTNKDIRPRNTKGQAHGYWESYWGNGCLYYKCLYYNGKQIGYEEWYGYSSNKLNKKRDYL